MIINQKKGDRLIKIYKTPAEIPFNPTDVFLHFTGNIFGIGCSAFNEFAINKILDLKQRDANRGFILLFSSMEQIKQYDFKEFKIHKIYSLLNQYLPGNLTTIFKTEDIRFKNIWQNQKVAIRIPTSKVLRDFIEQIGHPIVSSSINVSGLSFCSDINILHRQFSDWFDYGLHDEDEKADLPLPSTILDVAKNESDEMQIKCLREGSIPFAEIKESFQNPLVQFVCVGNICRSPMAEQYANIRFKEENLPFRVASCGLIENRKMISEGSKAVMKKNDILPTQSVSIQVDENIVRRSFLLICMSKDIKKHLLARFAEAANKTFTFAEYTENLQEIDDPYGLDFSHFEKAFDLIKKYTDDLIVKLKNYYLRSI